MELTMFRNPRLIAILHAGVALLALGTILLDVRSGSTLLTITAPLLLVAGIFNFMAMPFVPRKECVNLHSVRVGWLAVAGAYAMVFATIPFLVDTSVSHRLTLSLSTGAVLLAAYIWLRYSKLIAEEPVTEFL